MNPPFNNFMQMNNLMNNPMNNQTYNQMNIPITNQMNIQMNNRMCDPINNQMNYQMYNQMNIPINNQMNIPITNQMYNQMNNQANNQIYNQKNNQMNLDFNNRFSYNNLPYNNCNYPNTGIFQPIQNKNLEHPIYDFHTEMNNNQNNILTLNQINSKKHNNSNIETNNNIERNKPIVGAKLSSKDSDNISNIKYYEYPEITFTNEEEVNSKAVLLIGETGAGKSTFLNAIINIYLGITIDDDFRYIKPTKKSLKNNPVENNEKDLAKKKVMSDTKEITVYKIRPKDGLNFPPLKIVDTPGFGDTDGKKEDENHFTKFKDCFIKKLAYINCICYFVKSTENRFTERQEYIFNCFMKLFDKNINKNFIVGITNFFAVGEEEPEAINIFINNDFYYKNILNSDNLPEEEILKTYWYFASDNKIIFDNKIKRTDGEKLKWNYTEKEIKKFIENKIKKLQKITLKESGEILRIRYELKVENESLFSRIEQLLKEKEVYEFNKNQIDNFKNDIEEQEKLIQRHRDKKNEINEESERNKRDLQIEIKPYLKKHLITKKEPTDNYNTFCQECEKNCHYNCECSYTEYTIWFCNNLNFFGFCKICGHYMASHSKEKFKYSQYEEIEVIDRTSSLNLIDTYKVKDEENKKYITMINNVEDSINNNINRLNSEKEKLEEENNVYIEKLLTIKVECIIAYNKIEKNLDYLRINALKEDPKNLDEYIEKSIEKESLQKKQFFMEILRIYKKLIPLNIDFPNLTNQEYKELKI